ncbi:MAG: hypothetical protein JWP58_1280 [Hymenobacter sp.]|nr:hypothetical protein [Hymenobacter sp.]
MSTNLQTRLKKAGRLLPFALLPFAAHAQLGYSSANAVNAAGTYTDLAATGTAITTANTDDANSAAQNIGFTFTYNGTAFTQFILNTNGLIKLGSTAPSTAALYYENFAGGTGIDPLTAAAAAETNLLMPFNFDLLQGTGTAEYRVSTTGTTPNRVCTIQWKNVSDKSEPGTGAGSQYANFSFQTKLYEGGNIEFVYGPAVASANAAATRFPNVGLKGSGTAANQVTLALKAVPADPWSTTTFINQNYGLQTHNVNKTGLPDAGRTYRFVPGAAPTVANDDPAGAIALTLGTTCTPVSGTNANATTTPVNGYVNGTNPNTACGIAATPKDVWYKFTTNATGAGSTSASIQVTGAPAGYLRAFSATSAAGPFTEIACASGGTNNTVSAPLNLLGLSPSTTYYIFVSGFGSADTQGPFTICATTTAPLVCGDPTAATIGNATNTSVQISFTPGANNASYNVTYTSGGAVTTVSPAPTTSPITITGLAPGTAYTITIQSVCAGGSLGAVLTGSATTTGTPPAATYVTLPYTESFEGPWVNGLSTRDLPTANWRNSPATGDRSWRRDDDGAIANWRYLPAGAYTPAFSTGAHSARFHTYGAGPSGVLGFLDLYVNMSATGTKTLNFDYINPTGTDSLKVFVSTDGGATFATTPLRRLGISTAFAAVQPITFTSTSATTVIRFQAKSDFGDDDLGFDNLRLSVVTATTNAALAANVSLYPNPAHQSFQLSVPTGLRAASATLSNALGQVVQSRQLNLPATGGTADFNVSSLAPGLSTLSLKSGADLVGKRVVVE